MAGVGSAANTAPGNAGGYASLTPQQQAAIQAAAQQSTSGVTNPNGETMGAIDQNFQQDLTNSGLFSPNQTAALGQAANFDPHGSSFVEQGKSAQPFDQTLTQDVSQNYGGDINAINAAGGTGLSAIYPNTQQLQQFAPQNYNTFGPTPQVQAQTIAPQGQVSGGTVQNASVGPFQQDQAAQVNTAQEAGAYNQFASQEQAAMAPYNAQQQQQNNESLAARGLTNTGAAVQSGNELAAYQNANLQQQLGTMTGQFAGFYNQGVQQNAANQQTAYNQNSQQAYGAATSNAANQQQAYNQTGQQGYEAQVQNQNTNYNTANYNATAGNDANVYNANASGAVTAADMNAQNNWNNTLYQGQMQESQTSADAYLNTFNPNSGVTNAITDENQAAAPFNASMGGDFSNL